MDQQAAGILSSSDKQVSGQLNGFPRAVGKGKYRVRGSISAAAATVPEVTYLKGGASVRVCPTLEAPTHASDRSASGGWTNYY
jgi:hypothetical protein